MRVGGKYLVRLDMGLFGIIPKRIWLYAGNPNLNLDNQQERLQACKLLVESSETIRQTRQSFAKAKFSRDDIARHSQ